MDIIIMEQFAHCYVGAQCICVFACYSVSKPEGLF